jgi:hypothetical protein
MTPLPLTVSLGHGQTASSYASRLAGRNGAANAVEFCYDMGLDFWAILRGDPDAIGRLAALGGISAEALQAFCISQAGLAHNSRWGGAPEEQPHSGAHPHLPEVPGRGCRVFTTPSTRSRDLWPRHLVCPSSVHLPHS